MKKKIRRIAWYNKIIGIVTIFLYISTVLASESDEARDTAIRAYLKTEHGSKVRGDLEDFAARKVDISKEAAITLGILGSAAVTGKVGTERLKHTRIDINENVYVKPDITQDFRNSDTRGVVNLKIDF